MYTLRGTVFKGSVIERFNRTIKTRIARYLTENNTSRYITALPGLVQAYNNSYHRSIKMTPNEAGLDENRQKVFEQLYPSRLLKPMCSLKVGQKVRISLNKGVFSKGYQIAWSEDIYEIVNVEMVS